MIIIPALPKNCSNKGCGMYYPVWFVLYKTFFVPNGNIKLFRIQASAPQLVE